MIQARWDIDEHEVVTASRAGMGRVQVTYNGRAVYDRGHFWRARADVPFKLDDGRDARVTLTTANLLTPTFALYVGSEYMVATDSFATTHCEKCGAKVNPNDKFCDACGHRMPTAIDIDRRKSVKQATNVMALLAVLFAIFGVFLFFVQKSQTDEALVTLSSYEPTAVIPVEGKDYTVEELRAQVLWEPWGVLITNGVLAVVMAALYFWGRRAPLPALLAAAATYAVVFVVNAIADPKTIAQGIFLKIIVVLMLARGIRAAIEMRRA